MATKPTKAPTSEKKYELTVPQLEKDGIVYTAAEIAADPDMMAELIAANTDKFGNIVPGCIKEIF
jgi:hypothetical protein